MLACAVLRIISLMKAALTPSALAGVVEGVVVKT
jgi:hypothetical protein